VGAAHGGELGIEIIAGEGARRVGIAGAAGQGITQPQSVDQGGDAQGDGARRGPADEMGEIVAQVGIEPAVINAQNALKVIRGAGIAVKGEPGGEDLLAELRIAEGGMDDGIDTGAGVGGAAQAVDRFAPQYFEEGPHGGGKQVVLVPEIMVNNAGRDAGPGGNARDRGIGKSMVVNRGDRRVDKLFPADRSHAELGHPVLLTPDPIPVLGSPSNKNP